MNISHIIISRVRFNDEDLDLLKTYLEVLIGVDGCEETLEKVKKIKHKYRNLSIFMMNKNKGTYITINTILDLVKYENIIIFGADDIMKKNMVEEIIKHEENYDVIRFSFNDFTDNINSYKKRNWHAFGAIFYKKNIMNVAGGYKPWICSADTELLYRIDKKVKILKIDKQLFFRRVHDKSLSHNKETFNQIKKTSIKCEDVEGFCGDLKSDVNISNIKDFPFDEILSFNKIPIKIHPIRKHLIINERNNI